jgi:hypothetical protein
LLGRTACAAKLGCAGYEAGKKHSGAGSGSDSSFICCESHELLRFMICQGVRIDRARFILGFRIGFGRIHS